MPVLPSVSRYEKNRYHSSGQSSCRVRKSQAIHNNKGFKMTVNSNADLPIVNNDAATCCHQESISSSSGCCDAKPHDPDVSANNVSGDCCGGQQTHKAPDGHRLDKLLASLRTAWLLIPLILTGVLLLDRDNFAEVVKIASSALLGTAPYIFIAVLMLAFLKASLAESLVSGAFKGRENRMIVVAALFGGLAPFCSCEVIPFIAGLLALGAPLSAVMAFWLSSPLIDPPSLMITAGALGWEFAVGKAVSAVFLGLFGGFGVKLFMQRSSFKQPLKNVTSSSCSSGSCSNDAPYSGGAKWQFWQSKTQRRVFWEQGMENALFLFKWLSLAYLLEALLVLYVPASVIGGIVGGEGFGPIVVGALVGMPAYLNSYAAPPLVAGLMEQGMSSGSAMAFMVAGAISSIPAMTAVWSLVKKPVFVAYLGFGVSGAILFSAGFALFLGC